VHNGDVVDTLAHNCELSVDGGANAFGISRVEHKNKHQPAPQPPTFAPTTDHNRVEVGKE